MHIIRNILSKIVYGIARAHAFLLDGLVYIIETGVLLVRSFLRGCAILISMGGCLAVILLLGPVGHWITQHPSLIVVSLIILVFPLLGAASVSFLKAFKEISTRYLFHLSRHLEDPERYMYHAYRFYRQAYRQAEEDAQRRERDRREQQQKAWEDRFRQWHQYGGTWQQQEQVQANPYLDFKRKYEESCALLDVPVTADQYKIKLAYRKKAKIYHPDINKSPDATRKFQMVNEAYEFLNEDNIQRYKKI